MFVVRVGMSCVNNLNCQRELKCVHDITDYDVSSSGLEQDGIASLVSSYIVLCCVVVEYGLYEIYCRTLGSRPTLAAAAVHS